MGQKEFFIIPEEAHSFISSVMIQLHLNAVLRVLSFTQNGFSKQTRFLSIQDATHIKQYVTDVDNVYLTPRLLNDEQADDVLNNPVKYGCVIFTLPKITDKNLEMGYLSAKSSWLEDDNPDIPILYKSIAKLLRKILYYPMWVDVGSPEGLRLDKQVGYSDGAKLWENQGGNLVQFNTRFFTENRA